MQSKCFKRKFSKDRRLENLKKEIQIKKKKLNYKLQNNGDKVISPEIILLSQDLDRLIVEYIKLKTGLKPSTVVDK